MRGRSASNGPRAVSIQWPMVSQATSAGASNCASTSACKRGSMLARKTYGAFRTAGVTRGRKSAKTFSSSAIVSRTFRSSW